MAAAELNCWKTRTSVHHSPPPPECPGNLKGISRAFMAIQHSCVPVATVGNKNGRHQNHHQCHCHWSASLTPFPFCILFPNHWHLPNCKCFHCKWSCKNGRFETSCTLANIHSISVPRLTETGLVCLPERNWGTNFKIFTDQEPVVQGVP